MTREKYMLEQSEERNATIELDLDEDLLDEIKEAARLLDVSVEDFIYIALKEKMIEIEKEKAIEDGKFENIIDIYDLGMNIEEYINSGLTYLVISPNGKHVVLIPNSEYEKIKEVIKEK